MFSSPSEKHLQVFARLGLIAKGLVYCLIALIAFAATAGLSRHQESKGGSFDWLADKPFGKILLSILALSLLGYVMLRFVRAFHSRKELRKGWKAWLRMGDHIIGGLLYAGISILAFKKALDLGGSGQGGNSFASQALSHSWGKILFFSMGVILAVRGIFHCYQSVTKKFMKNVTLYHSDFESTFRVIGEIGYFARGLVLALAGYFVLRAGLHTNPGEASGNEMAFRFLQSNFGNWLLALFAFGTLAYGIFMFVRARHEKLDLWI